MSDSKPDRQIPPPEAYASLEAFGAALKELSDKAGFSLRALARECERAGHPVVGQTISNLFHGRGKRRRGNVRALEIILEAVGVTDPDDRQQWLDLERELASKPAVQEGSPPFRGLDGYDSTDAKLFFGRNRLTKQITTEMKTLNGVMVLTGASGAGKSSLLRAGVVTTLEADSAKSGNAWPVLYTEAGSDPLAELAEQLAAQVDGNAAELAAALRKDPSAAVEAFGKLMPEGSAQDAKVFLIVDQFEECLVEAGDDAAGPEPVEQFLAVLAALRHGPVSSAVLLSVRKDFVDGMLGRPSLQDLLGRSEPLYVGPMNEKEFAEVIEKPARSRGVTPDPRFVERLLQDIRTAHPAGVLPLLSHALRLTWEKGRGREMTVANYLAIHGLAGAVRVTAEKAYGALTAEQKNVARRLFLRLVHALPSGANVRRKVPLLDLFDEVDASEEGFDEVLDVFVDRRLLTLDGNTVEITHDSVLTAWPQLDSWLRDDRSDLLVEQQLREDARAWDEAGRSDDDLASGTKLQIAQDWRSSSRPADLTGRVRAYLDASNHKARRVTRRWQRYTALLAIVALAATALAVIVFIQANDADQRRDEADSRFLAALSVKLRGKDPMLSQQIALAGYRISQTLEARSALIDATALPSGVRMLGGDKVENIYAVGIHPRGGIAAVAADDTVRFWDITSSGHPKPRPPLPEAECAKIYALSFSADGNMLAAACDKGIIRLWDTHDPMAPVALPSLTGLGSKVYSLAFSPDSTLLAAAVADPPIGDNPDTMRTPGSIRLWSISSGTPRPLGATVHVSDTAPAKSVSFRPGNQQLAVGTDDGSVQIWDIGDPSAPRDPVAAEGVTKAIGQLTFSPKGDLLAAGGADNQVHLWTTSDPRRPTPFGKPIGGTSTWINAVAFSRDGTTLAIASSDAANGLRLYDLATGHITATMPHPAPVTSVKFNPAGTGVITGANDGAARLWPVTGPTLAGMDKVVSASRFSPDGATLALGSADLRLYDVSNPQRPRPLGQPITNGDEFSGTLAYAPNNRLLVEGHGKSGDVQLWDTTDRSHLVPFGPPLHAHAKQVETVAVNPDSTMLATGSRDRTVHLWDIRNPHAPIPLSTPGTFGGNVDEVAFHPTKNVLVAGSADKTVRLWDISDPKNPIPLGDPLRPGNAYVWSSIFSPDGTRLAVSLADSTIHLYDITDPAHPKPIGTPLTGPENYVNSLAFTTDGTKLAATSGDSSVWIWDLAQRDTPTVYATLTVGTGTMYPVNFQAHTRLLVAGSDDNKARIWSTDPDAAATLICATSGDVLTAQEWAKYVPDRPYDLPCR